MAVGFEGHQIWPNKLKTKEEGDQLKEVYAYFASKHDIQLAKFKEQVLSKMTEAEKQEMRDKLSELGMCVDFETCHVSYKENFAPLDLDYDLCYVRHGKTEGNTEPRIFQGYCDYWENQLNAEGKAQAQNAAVKMENMLKDFTPDLIICSPLGRAIETGEAFFNKHPEIPCRVHEEAREQQFGCWDNVQVRYLDSEDICHLFYLDQNALVKAPYDHIKPDGKRIPSENFVDLIIRQARFLKCLNDEPEVKKAKAEGRRAKVLVYGHSMAGAAISALLGHGQVWTAKGAIGFDGKYIMPNATPTLLTAKVPDSLKASQAV